MNPAELASIQIGNLADSEQSFDCFYQEYFPRVYNYCYFQIRHRQWAEDLTSAIFEKVLRRFHQFDPGKGSLSTWVFAIAKNQIVDDLRWNATKELVPDGDAALENLPAEGRSLDEEVSVRETQVILKQLLAQLPERDREILVLKFWGGLRSGEIADLVNMTENNVNVSVHRALRKLKQLIQDQQIVF